MSLFDKVLVACDGGNMEGTRMKKIILGIICLLLMTSSGYCQKNEPVQLGQVKEGVYLVDNGYSTTIIELENGRFRYWFKSDVPMLPLSRYPLTGTYAVNGGTITLVHKDIYEQEWTFMMFEGKVTLWRPAALKYWKDSNAIDHYGVLFPTTGKPEEIWGKKYGRLASNNLPITYTMTVVYIGGEKPGFIFVVGRAAYRSLDALKDAIAHMPAGSNLEYYGSDKYIRQQPLSTEAELNDLRQFCQAHQVNFIYHPGG